MGSAAYSSTEIARSGLASNALTRHASVRVQQRGVSRDTLDCLLAYGRHEPDHKGCSVVTFDGKALKAIGHFESRIVSLQASASQNLYAVVDSDGVVVTAGHRFRRVPRDLSLSALRPGRSRSPRVLNGPTSPYRN